MKHRGLYITLFALTVLLLAFPAVQQHAKLFKFWPLRGATVTTEQPRFTLKSFMDGSFQAQEDRYLSDHIGFREPFVRCYNQLCWSLFRKTQNKTVYVGKDNWLFNDYTIKHHYGQSVYDFGESNEAVVEKMRASSLMLYQLQEVLKSYGVSFFVCLAPGKDMVCEEYVPDVKFNRPPGVLAISYFPPVFDSLGINYLNLSEYYMQIRDTVSYPLYLKSSSHWSNQAAAYVADTLLHYMEDLSGLNIHDLRYSKPYLAPTRTPDADLEDVLNLLRPIENNANYYTTVTLDDDTTAVKPRWLVVGDSYYWEFDYNLPMNQLFDSHHYWYYNNTISNDPIHTNVHQVDIVNELLSTDIVMLLYSPCTLYDLNRQFLTKALFNFYYEDAVVKAKLEKVKQDIRNTPDWYARIEQKAANQGQTVEEALENNAQYLLYSSPGYYFNEFNEAQPASCRNSRVAKVWSNIQDPKRSQFRREMLKNEEWLNSIKKKAETSHISIDEAIERDLDWIFRPSI